MISVSYVDIILHIQYSARIRLVRIAVCDAFLQSCESIFMVRKFAISSIFKGQYKDMKMRHIISSNSSCHIHVPIY